MNSIKITCFIRAVDDYDRILCEIIKINGSSDIYGEIKKNMFDYEIIDNFTFCRIKINLKYKNYVVTMCNEHIKNASVIEIICTKRYYPYGEKKQTHGCALDMILMNKV